MAYIFDNNSFRVLGNYYPDRFLTFWRQFNQAVKIGKIISVREVRRELEVYVRHPHLSDWIERNKSIFLLPNRTEMRFVSEIFAVQHFQSLVSKQTLLEGRACADPFIVAKAHFINGCVVTEEAVKPNAARIPNVCEHFGVAFTNFQEFMERENWSF